MILTTMTLFDSELLPLTQEYSHDNAVTMWQQHEPEGSCDHCDMSYDTTGRYTH